jgi:uncharacterized membrane protein
MKTSTLRNWYVRRGTRSASLVCSRTPSPPVTALSVILRSLLLFISIVAALSSKSAFAATTLQVCNQSDSAVSVAYARYDDLAGTTFSSRGWYNIAAHSCGNVSVTTIIFRYFYLYVEGSSGLGWDGGTDTSHSYCVHPTNAFQIVNADAGDCTSRGYVAKNFYVVDTGSVTGTFTSNLTVASAACTLTASPASIVSGSSSTLTANCSPAITSYVWTGGSCAGTTASTCTVSPSSTTTYTVAGVNARGTGAATSATVTVTSGLSGTAVPTYRFNNPITGGHFLSSNESEKAYVLANLKAYSYEGIGFYTFATQVSSSLPVYRFSNSKGFHYFTISEAEKAQLLANAAYQYDGAAFYAYATEVVGSTPVYRFQNSISGSSFYTSTTAEYNYVLQNYPAYVYQNIVFYVRTQP